MREDLTREASAQMERLTLPAQRMASMVLNNVERLTDFQLELMQSYTHFTMEQWRDALNVHDARSLREYMEKQNRSAQELGRKLAESTRDFLSIGEDFSREAGRWAQQGMQAAVDVTRQTVSRAEREGRRTAEAAEEGARRNA